MKVIASRAKDIGGRSYQEDNLIAQKFAHNRFIIAAVMDGHGGGKCSAFLHKQLMKAIYTAMLARPSQPIGKDQLETALQSLHSKWEESEDFDSSGSTLSGLLIDKLRPFEVWFYNLGDSQAVMYNNDGVIKHKTVLHDLSNERQNQIKAKYPAVHISDHIFDTKRIQGRHSALNLSGAFGDTADPVLKKCLIKEVDIEQVFINGVGKVTAQEFPLTIVLGSDGLWDELSHDEVRKIILDFHERFQKVSVAERSSPLSTPADDLLSAVKRKGLKKDNVSIVVIIIERDRKRSKLELSTTAAMLPLLPPL